MSNINDAIAKFEKVVKPYIRVIYGFATETSGFPVLKYEVSMNSENSTRNTALLKATFECLLIGKTNNNVLQAKMDTFALAQTIKNALVNEDFYFQNLNDALSFDEKGNIVDNPALIMNFQALIEF